ncbi:MAG TPA: hypothetical protein VHF88_03030 [Thermoleophilaceae bacterium]|nr:hypothetical protein [Thermoleophilaceae bacterium]
MAAEGLAFDSRAAELLEPAMAALPAMVVPSGLVCYEVAEGDSAPRGESVRYALIVLLGLLRARHAGAAPSIDPDKLRDAIDAALERPEVTPGDVALRLWVESRAETGSANTLVERLDRSLDVNGGLAAREGLELGWIVTALAVTEDLTARGRELRKAALDQLIASNQGPSGLFRHFGEGGARRRFPNFATQIYSVLALAVTAGRGLDARALPAARRAADRLLALQLPDGGWPWMYDAERGSVVERYEVYSVHQHGMAPMTLYELSGVSGEERYAAAGDRGIPWLFGANELGAQMAPLERGMTYRSIRRVRPLDRLCLYANTATAAAIGRSRAGRGRRLELNRTCRPYELGWLVEAWAAMNGAAQR